MKSSRPRDPDPPSQLGSLERSLAVDGPLARIYLLVGEERYFRERALEMLVRAAIARGMEVSRHDVHDPDFDAGSFASDVSAAPMFAPARFIVLKNASSLLRKDGAHDSSASQRLTAFVRDTALAGSIVVDADSLRADHPVHKAASSAGVVFTSRRLFEDAPPWNPDPSKAELVQWCVAAARSRGVPLDAQRAVALVALTGNDLFALEANLERLKRAPPREWKGLVPWTRGGAPHEVAEELCRGRLAPSLAGLEALYKSGFRDRDGAKESDANALTAILFGALRAKLRQALMGAMSLESGADLAEAAERAHVPARPKARAEFETRVTSRPRAEWQRMYFAAQELERRAKSGDSIDANDWFAFAVRWQAAKRSDDRGARAAPRPARR